MKRLTKPQFISLIALGLLILAALGYFTYRRVNSSTLDILIAPASATITVNDHTYQNGTYRLPPGDYTATITHEGFDSQSAEFTLKDGVTTNLYLFLDPDADHATWYDDHPDDYSLMAEIGARLNRINIEEFTAQYPWAEDFPLRIVESSTSGNIIFRIDLDQTDACSTNICLRITDYTGNSRERAQQEIESRGANDIEVIYQYSAVDQLD